MFSRGAFSYSEISRRSFMFTDGKLASDFWEDFTSQTTRVFDSHAPWGRGHLRCSVQMFFEHISYSEGLLPLKRGLNEVVTVSTFGTYEGLFPSLYLSMVSVSWGIFRWVFFGTWAYDPMSPCS